MSNTPYVILNESEVKSYKQLGASRTYLPWDDVPVGCGFRIEQRKDVKYDYRPTVPSSVRQKGKSFKTFKRVENGDSFIVVERVK